MLLADLFIVSLARLVNYFCLSVRSECSVCTFKIECAQRLETSVKTNPQLCNSE